MNQHRLLIVSADTELLGQAEKVLGAAHYSLRCARSAQEGLDISQAWPVDLVVTDYRVSDLNPNDFMEQICHIRRRVRIIVLATKGQTIEILRAAHTPILAVLHHPCLPQELLPHIEGFFQAIDAASNRRLHHRYLFPMETQCILINPFSNQEGRPMPALMRDVSRSGVALLIRRVLPVPAMLKLIVHLNDQTRPVSMLAKSISCTLTQIPGVYRLGAKFVGLLPSEIEEAIVTMGQIPELAGTTDINIGRPFYEAIMDWLRHHWDDADIDLTGQQLETLARELSGEIDLGADANAKRSQANTPPDAALARSHDPLH